MGSNNPENKNAKPYVILVEGNVGSGKTKFMSNFSDIPGVQIKYEPLDKWQNYEGINLLDLMYRDGKNYLLFQLLAFLTQLQTQLESDQPILMMERSIYSARFVFVENIKSNPNHKLEAELLIEWYDFLMDQLKDKLDIGTIIYLKTDPRIAMARTQGRGRTEEENLDLDFFNNVHITHEKWLTQKIWGTKVAPNVLTLNGNKHYNCMEEYVDMVKTIIKQHLD